MTNIKSASCAKTKAFPIPSLQLRSPALRPNIHIPLPWSIAARLLGHSKSKPALVLTFIHISGGSSRSAIWLLGD